MALILWSSNVHRYCKDGNWLSQSNILLLSELLGLAINPDIGLVIRDEAFLSC
jgi:hypothetical protein